MTRHSVALTTLLLCLDVGAQTALKCMVRGNEKLASGLTSSWEETIEPILEEREGYLRVDGLGQKITKVVYTKPRRTAAIMNLSTPSKWQVQISEPSLFDDEVLERTNFFLDRVSGDFRYSAEKTAKNNGSYIGTVSKVGTCEPLKRKF